MKSLRQKILLAISLVTATFSFADEPANAPSNEVDALVQPYLQIQSALADDNLSGAKTGAQAYLDAAEDNAALRDAAEAIAGAADIAAARTAFLELSNGVIAIIRSSGTTGDDPLYIAHCPMAFGGNGGDWLQSGTTVANPYYGASMLRCGAIQQLD